ncbi:MAG: hypothetical protein HS122_15865 [Opitutaceae bacterium]|nr:hypothetical protein [Opitutaceae bacterium]
MGLNRAEQTLSDYVLTHVDERQYWQEKVREVCRNFSDEHEAARRLEAAIKVYFRERASVVRELGEVAAREGLTAVSLRTLAEYWIRVWTVPRKKVVRSRSIMDRIDLQ